MLNLLPVASDELKEYKKDMQEAFQQGFEDVFGKTDEVILPEKDIDQALKTKGAVAYKAVLDGCAVGGAIVVIDKESQINHLDFLFVKHGTQGRGVGKAIWFTIERLHPETSRWETCTPYFERRNIHFYVNVCGFHIVEFFNAHHPMPGSPSDFVGDGGEGMFELRKEMPRPV